MTRSRVVDRVTDPTCVFCRIVAGELPATVVHDEDEILAFRDIAPNAPSHVLIIPKTHISSVATLTDELGPLSGRLLVLAARIAETEGIDGDGYRVVTNVGEWGGQSVDHLHLHVLGGRKFAWPPG